VEEGAADKLMSWFMPSFLYKAPENLEEMVSKQVEAYVRAYPLITLELRVLPKSARRDDSQKKTSGSKL
jgi:hypothetical protein